jgi:hypothetical protein
MELNKEEIRIEIAQWLRKDLHYEIEAQEVDFVIELGKALLDNENLFITVMHRLYENVSYWGAKTILKFIKNL